MASIDLRSVSKLYPNGSYGVRDVDLRIENGEFVIFLGPSGCGKSTTLRMIAGLESISAGDLLIGERNMNRVAPRDRNVAVVFQSYALYPHMSVRANMGFGLKMRGASVQDIASKTEAAASLLGLSHLLDRKPAALSGGQRQRVALGRAIVREPDVFLLDEPLSNLDAQLRAEMRLELVKLHRRLGRTTIHVTHDQVEAMTMGDRICIMRDGQLIQAGRPLDVYADPVNLFVARFLASPAMNLLPMRLKDESGVLVIEGSDGFRFTMPQRHAAAYAARAGTTVILGLRPEDIYEAPQGARTQPFDLAVTAVEALGAEIIVLGTVGGGMEKPMEVTARLSRHAHVQVGETVRLHADLLPAHLFDPQSEQAIARPSIRGAA
ncbi:glycerol-3-phosphate ABC transporter ATP-binding protein [Xaviernesmea oryzae]|uniref:Glycerol-3-phosphate ABC transporter ATP-binding protein n=1 Tax=Xaviernesmea oryzae TaxID=464029 RepID=A0A1Q9B0Z2_9HYPH|nr:ABC transporter ATP-binding protein [Xaviernesmea oryzae]OLP61630.1 glycerol-3-phosphate ABC transporter ATP-binding protein [Xaviernesmea oryzae]SEL05568.1 multiple sugar transport system ATP-binding protein [Xaviernesmea oryzae]